MQGNVTWDVGIDVSYLQVYGVLDATVYVYVFMDIYLPRAFG